MTVNQRKKSKLISFRVTDEDEKEIQEKAKEAKMTVSNFCRRQAKGAVVKAPSPLVPIADKELVVFAKEIANNLKETKERGQELDEEIYNNVNDLIRRVNVRINNINIL